MYMYLTRNERTLSWSHPSRRREQGGKNRHNLRREGPDGLNSWFSYLKCTKFSIQSKLPLKMFYWDCSVKFTLFSCYVMFTKLEMSFTCIITTTIAISCGLGLQFKKLGMGAVGKARGTLPGIAQKSMSAAPDTLLLPNWHCAWRFEGKTLRGCYNE